MDNFRIFKLTIDDAQWLSIIAKRAYFDHYRHLWFDNGEWYAEYCFNLEQLQSELSNENALFFGVEDATEALGFMKLNVDYPLSKTHCQSQYLELFTFETPEIENALELERIYLTKTGQGRGIGKKLFQLAFDIAHAHGKEVVWLKAMDTSLNAIGFYEKMGFETCATLRLNFDVMKVEMRGMIAMKFNVK
jgi:diamine N-acetyltransferase